MNNFRYSKSLCVVLTLLIVSACEQEQTSELSYPATKAGDVVDTLHGVSVADPFRWLEDDIRENKDVQEWVDAQNKVTHTYLDGLGGRDRLTKRMTELWNYEKFGMPTKRGNRYFYTHNSGLQNQSVLYVQDGLDGEHRTLIDPNPWADDGTKALAGYVPSPDGSRLIYAIQDGGSDWRSVKVLNVETGDSLVDSLEWIKFSQLSWSADGKGFFYSRFPAPQEGQELQHLNENQSVYYHMLGTNQEADKLIFMRPEFPKEGVSAATTDDGKYLVIRTSQRNVGKGNEVHSLDLADPTAQSKPIIEGFENSYNLIGSVEDRLYFSTNDDAPMNRIIAVDVKDSDREKWQTIIPEGKDVIRSASIVGGKLIVTYLEDVKSAVRIFALDGTASGSIDLPGIGSVGGFGGKVDDSETFYRFSSFNTPTTLYRYDISTGESSIFNQPELNFDPSSVVVKQVFYPSKDGTKIPMFIIHKKDMDFSKPASTILYGYGGFNVSLTPSFNVANLTWIDMGGVFAIANLRGGSEYGEAWHDAGKLDNKQNVFDDFISAGEYLISQGMTSKDKLAIYGHSNGGLLVGATANQRPDLFAAVLAGAGVMDMLRFNKFTAGRYWINDYGVPEKENDFKNLYAYSPYHNVRGDVDYPAIIVTAADRDDRVVPGHSFKYAAELQASAIGPKPHIIRIETRAGHGSGMPTEKRIAVYVDYWAFAAEHTGLVIE